MAEQAFHRECFGAGSPVTVGGITLLPIERTVTHARRVGAGLWCWSAKAPYALAIRDAFGVRALAAGADAVSLDGLRQQVPGLDALLGAA